MKKSADKIERRGGPRPNTGGAREGAGRPPSLIGEFVKRSYTIALDLENELINFRLRGFGCKSEYANHLLRKGLQESVD
jgi:hypothetical protein